MAWIVVRDGPGLSTRSIPLKDLAREIAAGWCVADAFRIALRNYYARSGNVVKECTAMKGKVWERKMAADERGNRIA